MKEYKASWHCNFSPGRGASVQQRLACSGWGLIRSFGRILQRQSVCCRECAFHLGGDYFLTEHICTSRFCSLEFQLIWTDNYEERNLHASLCFPNAAVGHSANGRNREASDRSQPLRAGALRAISPMPTSHDLHRRLVELDFDSGTCATPALRPCSRVSGRPCDASPMGRAKPQLSHNSRFWCHAQLWGM